MSIDQQLERLLSAVSTLASVSEQNTREIVVMRESIGRLAHIAEQHQMVLEQHQRNFEVAQRNFDMAQQNFDAVLDEIRNIRADTQEMQAEVRGLQTENRRILDHLLNRNGDQG